VKEMKNFDQLQQPIEESLQLMHTIGLRINVVNSKKQALKELKKTTNDAQYWFVHK
jgi:hypothetical protein